MAIIRIRSTHVPLEAHDEIAVELDEDFDHADVTTHTEVLRFNQGAVEIIQWRELAFEETEEWYKANEPDEPITIHQLDPVVLMEHEAEAFNAIAERLGEADGSD